MAQYYFMIPFGTSGDKVAIPTAAQPGGAISYTQGYGPNYSAPRLTDPAALTIERNKMNQLFFAITSGLQQYQQHGTPEYITSADNGGGAYGYDKYARVRWDNGSEVADYVSLVASNTQLPSNASNWAKLQIDPAYLSVANTWTQIQTINAANTPLVINSTNSAGLKITMKDAGTNRGGIGASSTYSAAAYLSDLTTIVGGWDNSGHLVPGANATYDLGSASLAYRNATVNRLTLVGNTIPVNGLYLSAANTVSVAASSTRVASFTTTGMNATAIGATTPSTGAFTTLSVNSNVVTFAGEFTTSGAFSTTFTVTGATNVTLPTSGTLATINSPTFTGTPAAPTASPGTNTTQIATTAFVLANQTPAVFPADGRLTLTTGVPVTTSNVTAAANIYYTPYRGNKIALYTGSAWLNYTFTQLTLALGTLTAARPHDVFINYNGGTPQLVLLAWTNDTTRATALAYQDGVLVRSGAATQRYLGTFYTTSTTTTEDSAARRFLFNYYNRDDRELYAAPSGSQYTYTTATLRASNGNTTYGDCRVGFIAGVVEDCFNCNFAGASSNTASAYRYNGIGLNSTTVSALGAAGQNTQLGQSSNPLTISTLPTLGLNYLQMLEFSTAAGVTTWYTGAGGVVMTGTVKG